MAAQKETPRVLVVDDEESLAETYKLQLQSEFTVDVATSGEEALSVVGDDYEVVLLDRRMHDYSGDEILQEMHDRGLDCQVIMVTAVEPDVDIIDMQCTDYLVKPVAADQLRAVIERARQIATYSERRQQLSSKKLKRNILDVERDERELEDSGKIERLQAEIERLEREVDELEAELDIEDPDRYL